MMVDRLAGARHRADRTPWLSGISTVPAAQRCTGLLMILAMPVIAGRAPVVRLLPAGVMTISALLRFGNVVKPIITMTVDLSNRIVRRSIGSAGCYATQSQQ
jgi:hypothetical protein